MEFATGFVRGLPDRSLKTLVARVQTSVGQTIEVHPERDLLEELKRARLPSVSGPDEQRAGISAL
jgi:hypothetical protein